ncbi:MAG: hypothetical protein VX309_03460 [Pseudomonadota bacterium]|nr:hypothetical protein [Pseudomonadota bacterium]MEE3154564.1 hypothetical protein [Pseudomonadota bacterium]
MAQRPRYTSQSRFGPTREWEGLPELGSRTGARRSAGLHRLALGSLVLVGILIAALAVQMGG